MNTDVRQICLEGLVICETFFRRAEQAVLPAQWVPWEGSHNWRFVEQLPQQALLQKLARYITGLRTLDLLLQAGYLQEVGVFFRILDELGEDISFIAIGLITRRWTENHDRYLAHFWSESDEPGHSPVQRKSIRAYVNRAFDQHDPASADTISRTIYKTYSDFLHARSAPIMGMVHGPPPQFDLSGIADSEAVRPYVEQAPSYFYRGAVATSMVAKAVCSTEVSQKCYSAVLLFERHYNSMLFLS